MDSILSTNLSLQKRESSQNSDSTISNSRGSTQHARAYATLSVQRSTAASIDQSTYESTHEKPQPAISVPELQARVFVDLDTQCTDLLGCIQQGEGEAARFAKGF